MQALSERTANFTDSVIRRMTRIANEYGAVNLSQGFPDFDPPAEITDRLAQVAKEGPHQYALTWGAKNFRDAVAKKYEHFSGVKVDPESEIVVTCGSTEAMMATMMSITNPGDKVVIFSPFYENYGADTILSGAQPIYVPLVPPSFDFDREQLEDAFRQGAKAIIVCNSLSKTYSITGWRLGYVIAGAEICDRVKKVHDFLTVGAAAPLMEAATVGLLFQDEYYRELADHYAHMKEVFVGGLKKLGFRFTDPQGAYYVLMDVSEFGVKDDVKFCEWLAREVGVAAVPGSSFFREDVNHLIRFHFAKQDKTLQAAIERLSHLREKAAEATDVDWR